MLGDSPGAYARAAAMDRGANLFPQDHGGPDKATDAMRCDADTVFDHDCSHILTAHGVRLDCLHGLELIGQRPAAWSYTAQVVEASALGMHSTLCRHIFTIVTAMRSGHDPAGVETPEEFVELLRLLRADSGLSFWEIQRHAHSHGYHLEPAAMVHALGRPVLPDWQIVVGLLVACGYEGTQIDCWRRVHRELLQQAVPAYDDEDEDDPVAAGYSVTARRWTYPHVLYTAAAGALAVLVVLVAARWDTGHGTIAASGSSSAALPTQGPAMLELAPVVTATSPATSAPPPADPGVLRTGTLTLTDGQSVDLETGAFSGDLDIVAFGGAGLKASDRKRRLERMPSMPTKQTCQSLKPGQLDRNANKLAAGQWLCVHTSSGRWARVSVTATGSSLKLAYAVWT